MVIERLRLIAAPAPVGSLLFRTGDFSTAPFTIPITVILAIPPLPTISRVFTLLPQGHLGFSRVGPASTISLPPSTTAGSGQALIRGDLRINRREPNPLILPAGTMQQDFTVSRNGNYVLNFQSYGGILDLTTVIFNVAVSQNGTVIATGQNGNGSLVTTQNGARDYHSSGSSSWKLRHDNHIAVERLGCWPDIHTRFFPHGCP